ncbi:hypothetical protein A33Q_1193 [Indibacter alkaliphilus LW1]|uniref:Uncharacterized protein n=1 Tax=Indibacter alkaliphilus (strain CCUG 57479 / KCTC 22604 / LW1) TaxID=1189612 RepID=S2DHU5_INDAL|nr:hypothetical protein A33Q_1193 [Indibacter alkaliphilus LW1]
MISKIPAKAFNNSGLGKYGGIILIYIRGLKKCITPAKI